MANAPRLNADYKIEWFAGQVNKKIGMTMESRVRIAAEIVKTAMVKNISRPVTKVGGRVFDRSKPGEFPKAETAQLMRTIFVSHSTSGGTTQAHIGTPLDYGLKLETQMNRSFLRRTLQEQLPRIKSILTKPIT